MNTPLYYGLESTEQARELVWQVCNVLGHGSHYSATNMLLETAAVETQLGRFPDCYASEGFGLCQFDRIGFEDVVTRTRQATLNKVQRHFGYDLRLIKVEALANDPLLSFILCRLMYRLRPEPIPNILQGRASYWKKFYNSSLGKGTTTHYINSALDCLYETVEA